jgi:hypothetical protein
MGIIETNIAEVFNSGYIHHKQSLINKIRQSVQSPIDAMSNSAELSKVPLNKRDVFFYIIEFMLKIKQSINGFNPEVALLAAKIEIVRRVTNYKLNNSKESYLHDGFDFLIGPEAITHHDINESEIDLDDKITGLQELKMILLQMDKGNNDGQNDREIQSFIDSKECSDTELTEKEQSTPENKFFNFPICDLLGVGQYIQFPTSGVFSLNCLVEDISFKEHEILVIYNNQTGKNRCRIIGYDFSLNRLVRLTHQLYDEHVMLHLSSTSSIMARLALVKERSIIKAQAKKIMHNIYSDLLIVADDTVNVLGQWSVQKHKDFLQKHAGNNNPNKLWQYTKVSFVNAAKDDQIIRVANACIKTMDGSSTSQPELLYLVRLKNSRMKHIKGEWKCKLFRDEVSLYKPRVFDTRQTSELDESITYRFKGVALIEFKALTSDTSDQIVNTLKLFGEIEPERPSTKPVKTGDSNYLQTEKDEPMQSEIPDSDGFENDIFSDGVDDYDDYYVTDLAYELQDARETIEDDYGDESFPDESEYLEDQFDPREDESYYHQMAYDQLEEEHQIYADILMEDYSPDTTIQKAYETANDVCRILWPN